MDKKAKKRPTRLKKPERMYVVVNGGGWPSTGTLSYRRKDAIAKYEGEHARWGETWKTCQIRYGCAVVPVMLCPIDPASQQAITDRE